jgi:hypothetical protein
LKYLKNVNANHPPLFSKYSERKELFEPKLINLVYDFDPDYGKPSLKLGVPNFNRFTDRKPNVIENIATIA